MKKKRFRQLVHFGGAHHRHDCSLYIDKLKKHLASKYEHKTYQNGMIDYKYKISHPLRRSCVTQVSCAKCLKRIIRMVEKQISKHSLGRIMLNEMDY
jgi:hypothetical protein